MSSAGVLAADATVRKPTISGPVTGGKGWPFGAPLAEELKAHGYLIEEYFAEGVADAYEPAPGTTVGEDGRWTTVRTAPAAYKTRMMVVRPADPARFSGTVLVNWQNVTAGMDLGAPAGRELFRAGHAWVGATVQKIAHTGMKMGSSAHALADTTGLLAWDPDRYGSLVHPGDAYALDIYGQIGRSVRGERAGGPDPMAGLLPTKVIAIGASQSAAGLATYINVAHAHHRVFDGFLPEVHYGVVLWGSRAPLRLGPDGDPTGNYKMRDDLGTPILVVNSENEALPIRPVQQPDTDTYRFWEVAGGAHTAFTGARNSMAAVFERDGIPPRVTGDQTPNTLDGSYVHDAALRAMVAWVRTGKAPPRFPLIEVDGGQFVRDADGNVRGGLRLPEMEAPVAVQYGTNETDGIPRALRLGGLRQPFTEVQLRARYPSRAAYLAQYDAAADRLAAAGGVLPEDFEALKAVGRELAEALPHQA